MKPYIGLRKVWYCEPITTKVTATSLKALLKLETTKAVKNVHKDTFSYEQNDADITDYKNDIDGKIYFRDVVEEGSKVINFTLGEYDLKTKAELQGGSVSAEGVWEAPQTIVPIYKAIIAMTKTGNYIVFTRAAIVGKVDTQEKNLGQGVQATAMSNETDGVADEYWVPAEIMTEVG